MKISVIIPTYNEEKYITSCLKSLSQQTQSPYEIIVVDDGSTDQTLVQLKQLQASIPRLIILKQNHLGAGPARNLGAKRSRGDILVFVDADMEFDSNFLVDLTYPIITKQSKGTFSQQELVKNWPQPLAKCWNYNFGFFSRHLVFSNQSQSPVFRAILKKEFNKVSGFNPSQGYVDDWSLSKKLKYSATPTQAKYYHYNPDTFIDIFTQARWRAKRQYKLGFLGATYRLVLHSLPISLLQGLIGIIKFKLFIYLPFKLVLDAASFIGILEFYLFKKSSK